MSLPRAVIRSFKFFSFIIIITFIYNELMTTISSGH
jgi:hypothetical protein